MSRLSFYQPEGDLKEDFMFPMSNRLSYASSPESDVELARPSSMYTQEVDDLSPLMYRRMQRANSDPSLATQENIPGIPPYPTPPIYNRGPVHRQVKTICFMITPSRAYPVIENLEKSWNSIIFSRPGKVLEIDSRLWKILTKSWKFKGILLRNDVVTFFHPAFKNKDTFM